ncbi:hypothetical protein AB0J09_62175, partial [Nonomuraea sp. NPDC049784]
VPESDPGRAAALWADSMLAIRQGDLVAGMPKLHESIVMAREAGDRKLLAHGLRTLGVAAFLAHDTRRGLSLVRQALALHRAIDDLDGVMLALYVAATYGSDEDPDQAAKYGEQLLALCERQDALVFRAYAQLALGVARWNLDDSRQAEALVTTATEFTGAINDRWCLTQCLEVLAWIAGARGEHDRAAELLGAAHAMWQAVGASPEWMSYHTTWHVRCTRQARRALGGPGFAAAFRQGARLGPERAVAYALGDPARTRARRPGG